MLLTSASHNHSILQHVVSRSVLKAKDHDFHADSGGCRDPSSFISAPMEPGSSRCGAENHDHTEEMRRYKQNFSGETTSPLPLANPTPRFSWLPGKDFLLSDLAPIAQHDEDNPCVVPGLLTGQPVPLIGDFQGDPLPLLGFPLRPPRLTCSLQTGERLTHCFRRAKEGERGEGQLARCF